MWRLEEGFSVVFKNCFKLTTIIILVVSLVGCTCNNDGIYIQTKNDYKSLFENSPDSLAVNDEWTVFVLKEKTDIPVVIADENDEIFKCIPLLPVLRCVGVEITEKKGVYELKYNGEKLYIDFDKQVIHEKNSDFNVLNLATGGKIYYRFIGNDVIACSTAIASVFFLLELDLVCHIHSDSKTIEIKQVTKDNNQRSVR